METTLGFLCAFLYTKFKSYYVVWKLDALKTIFSIIEFKSYYVVWKLMRELLSRTDNVCLNRTMQYGNGRWRENSRGEIMFKSYYVVWKLSKLCCEQCERK